MLIYILAVLYFFFCSNFIYWSLYLNNYGFLSPFVEIQKAAQRQEDLHLAMTGGLHLMLLQMDLLTHLDMGPMVIADGIVTQHKMVM